MIDHDRALELAAAALDFALSDSDRQALTAHLDGCDACRAVDAQMRVDARRIADLSALDAPDGLRQRILAAAGSVATPAVEPTPADGPLPRPRSRAFQAIPPRYRGPLAVLASAAVIVALIGGTLVWRSSPDHGPDTAAATPSASGAAASGAPTSSGPPTTAGPPTTLPGTETWAPVADLTADDAQGGIIALASGFRLASLDGTPVAELARHLSVQPPIAFTVAPDAGGRSATITPTQPLTAGAVYRFSLTAGDGRTLDSWAFQAHQPLQVASTLPRDTAIDVPSDTGIEVTFDQDGVVDAASHITIAPKTAGRFEVHGRTIVFVPTKRLAKATIYNVTVTKGVAVKGTTDGLASDVRFSFETSGVATTGKARVKFEFTNDVFDSTTSVPPALAVWADPAVEDQGDRKIPKSARILVDRLPDLDAAISAYRQVRAFPNWARGSSATLVPTTGLVRVADFDAKFVPVDMGYQGFLLPKRLAAGWYIVTLPAPTHPVQTILQVTDIAGYLVVSDTKTLVWANDLATRGPVSGSAVASDGVDLGHTDPDGALVIATPANLKASHDGSCGDECLPVVTVRSGDRAIFLPAERGAYGDAGDYGYADQSQVNPYWTAFNIDRTLYRRSDTVNYWGVVRDRTTGNVPGSVSIRLYRSDPHEGASQGASLGTTESRPNGIGAYSGSVTLDDLSEGSYVLESSVGDKVVGSIWFQVDRILKPAYRLEVTTGRRVYFEGDQVKVTATATFFEGSPVAGVPLRLDGLIEKTFTTDARGTATTRSTIHVGDDTEPGEPEVQEIAVSPARAEEGQILGVSRQIVAFHSLWTVDATTSFDGGTIRVAGSVHAVDRERLEREIAQGADIWSLDPAGEPISDRTVTARFTELIRYHIAIGSHYDFIEKKVVTDYDDGVNERSAGSVTATTRADGTFSASITARDPLHTYRVDLSATDPDKHAARWRGWTSAAAEGDESGGAPRLVLTTAPTGDHEFGVGDEIDLTMRDPGNPDDKPGRYLFYSAEQGLRDVVVQPSSRYRATFDEAALPDLEINAVRFTGTGYVEAESYTVRFRRSDRELTVGLATDAPRYAPGGEVSLTVTTKDSDGRPVPATVVLRAVDEKLYAMGGAEAVDLLGELYQDVGSGITFTYRSHLDPIGRPEGGDTTGGGDDAGIRDDFKDVVLFKQVDTGADGRAVVTFKVADDLTSWRLSASAFGQSLFAGEGSIGIPVGLPFFVDATIATDFLVTDRPAIGLRAYGTDLAAGAAVTFAVDSDSLGLHAKGLKGTAFGTTTVPLPKLTVGLHSITITATTGTGASARTDALTRTFMVLPSRLAATRADHVEMPKETGLKGGTGHVELVVTDAGPARYIPLLLSLTDVGSARFERTLAASLAASLVRDRFGFAGAVPAIPFDVGTYQTEAGGIAVVPYSGGDLEASVLAALVAPDRVDHVRLAAYLWSVIDNPKTTRERRMVATAGLAGLGTAVLPGIRAAAADPDLTIRERLMIGLGAAALGDAATARSIGTNLENEFGEITSEHARLRAGATLSDITQGTALMAMLAAANGDPLALRFWAYVEANPGEDATYALHAVGYVTRLLDRAVVGTATFAFTLDGARQVAKVGPGETFHLSISHQQFESLALEPVTGQIGVTSSWQEAVKPTAIAKDPDLKVSRTMTPGGPIGRATLVRVDLTVDLGAKAPAGCHLVTDLVPSGLVPVGNLQGFIDEEGVRSAPSGVIYPYAQVGQRVTFCAEKTKKTHVVHLRYYARVVTSGTYTWEPTLVESLTRAGRAAVTKASTITIR